MCLGHSAHGVVPSHEVFQSPYKVDLIWEEAPTPENYYHYYQGRDLPPTLKVWRVQLKSAEEDETIGWGVVSHGNGFADSPDAEYISSGLNQKGPNSVALGRHGNYFHWGFSASPTMMTESGRKVFLNAIHYIRKFDHQLPLVRRVAASRLRALNYPVFHASLPEIFEGRPKEELEAYQEKDLNRSFPPELIAKFGDDMDKYLVYYEENRDYLYIQDIYGIFTVDEDAKALGIANNDIALLDTCISLLEKGEQVERARRLLERYTRESFESPAEWRAWFMENRDRLFFTDTGGYLFLVNPYK